MKSFLEWHSDLADRVVKHGLDVREDFWNDFISLCNNAEGVGELLGVPAEKVALWGSKIEAKLKEAKKDDKKYRKRLIKTGGI